MSSFHTYHSNKAQNGGFTLLEILLTMAVLIIGLTAVFQTTQSAMRQMAKSRELTEAQNACQAVLNELLARSAPIQPEQGRTVQHLPDWKIQVEIYPASQEGLYVLHISAQQFSPVHNMLLGTTYQLLRWVPEERIRFPDATETPTIDEFGDMFQ